MQYEGVITKMLTEIGNPIQYYMVFENNFLNVNQLLDKDMVIEFTGFQCLSCGKKKKIFRMGFCYDCFYSSPMAGDWIMRPELSTAHLDVADRDLEYEKKVQLQPHIVYLAGASDFKVGVTRKTQIPTRWIDQGASQAVIIAEVPNRYLAGIAEVALKKHYSDKINWKKMLLNNVSPLDLQAVRTTVENLLPAEVQPYFVKSEPEIYTFHYPVLEYPKKITSLKLSATSGFRGKLKGIKGQYLLFNDGTVFNVRSFEGYVIKLSVL